LFDVQRDIEQRVCVAIIRIDGIDLEQAHVPAGLPR
jgi:hypothetical protein